MLNWPTASVTATADSSRCLIDAVCAGASTMDKDEFAEAIMYGAKVQAAKLFSDGMLNPPADAISTEASAKQTSASE